MTSAPFKVCIPDDLSFSDLKLKRDTAAGDISFDWSPIYRICKASGINHELFTNGTEDNTAALLVAWYQVALNKGEPADLIAEQLKAEVSAEDEHGAARVLRGSGSLN